MAFVIHFDHEVELLQDLTSLRKQLEAALELLEMPQRARRSGMGRRGGGGGTSLYNSVLLASDELMRKQSGRKALIMLSDGVDNGSKISLASSIESAQRADTLVYSILFADPQGYGGGFRGGPPGTGRRGGRRPQPARHTDGKEILERLAAETGGGFLDVSKKDPIDKIYQQIEEELRNQYNLGYTSDQTSAGPGFRKVGLTTRQKGLTVQTRPGYYADH
jgi:VWFA-related protein